MTSNAEQYRQNVSARAAALREAKTRRDATIQRAHAAFDQQVDPAFRARLDGWLEAAIEQLREQYRQSLSAAYPDAAAARDSELHTAAMYYELDTEEAHRLFEEAEEKRRKATAKPRKLTSEEAAVEAEYQQAQRDGFVPDYWCLWNEQARGTDAMRRDTHARRADWLREHPDHWLALEGEGEPARLAWEAIRAAALAGQPASPATPPPQGA